MNKLIYSRICCWIWQYMEISLSSILIWVSVFINSPHLDINDRGGSFLIPYFFLLFFMGIPLFYTETAIGQLVQKVLLIVNCNELNIKGYSGNF